MLNSAEHEIYPAYKCSNATIVGILTFISRIKKTGFGDLNLKCLLILAISVFTSSLDFMAQES